MADRPGANEHPADRDGAEAPQRDPIRTFWRELPILLVVALVLAIVLKSFVVQVFFIPSESMSPTLERGDRILVCRICTSVGGVKRGDVIVFSDPQPASRPSRGVVAGALHWLAQGIGVAQPEDEDFVKRVVGLPGDVVELHDGQLFVNGTAVQEPYLNPQRDTSPYGPVTVPDGMLFVLGDNRAHSGDSRFEPPVGVGLVPEDAVIGRVVLVVYPAGRWGTV